MSEQRVRYSSKSLLSAKHCLCARLPITFKTDMECTLNAKYSIQKAVTPTVIPVIQFFGIGIGGKYNVTDTNLSEAYKPSPKEMDEYTALPIRCLAEDEDALLTTAERANYRIRVPETINGVKYYCYYLKKMTFTDEVYYSYTDPDTNQEVFYTLDSSYLNPTGVKPSTSSTTVASVDIATYALATISLSLDDEMMEAINIKYGGDLRYASLSEIATYSGEDKVLTTTDYQGNSFNYTESIYTCMETKHTINGIDMNTVKNFSGNMYFSDSTIILTT